MPPRTRVTALPLLALAVLLGVGVRIPFQGLGEAAGLGQAFAMHATRPKNAYMHFAGAKRAEYAKGGAGVTEVAKELGAAWRALGAKQRKPYEKMAEEDRQRFAKELEQGLVPKERRSKAEKQGKPRREGPKRPISAYVAFVKDMHGKTAKKGQSPTEVMRALGAKWQTLSASAKKKYEGAAAEDRARYEKELAALEA